MASSQRLRFFSLQTASGSTCCELTLCSDCDEPLNRSAMDSVPRGERPGPERAVAGSWAESTTNPDVRCIECGRQPPSQTTQPEA